MIERSGNIWESGADAICVTTNSVVKSNGEAVMGKGIALQAAQYYPMLPVYVGNCLKTFGNKVFMFPLTSDVVTGEPFIVTFPTKLDWRAPSLIGLIAKSAEELVVLADQHGWNRVALTRVGCGNGNLKWADVKPVIEKYFDDRFEVWER
jgi:O-acetyl-ADP-ribose deacetylase (regulator of RNase III)